MKFTCEKDKLLEALTNVQKAVSTKSTIAALEGVLIIAYDGMVALCGYNTELGITTTLPAQIKEEGKVVLSAHLFTEIVRKLPGEFASLEVSESLHAILTGGVSRFELVAINAAQFPDLPKVDSSDYLDLPVYVLKSMIKQTIFAVADMDAKPIHTGSLFEIKNKTLTIASVDGYRLAVRIEPVKEDLELRFVVPGKTLREVLRLLPDGEEPVRICAGMRHVAFYVGNYCVISRLLEGDFLEYKATVPAKTKYKVLVSTQEFADSIDRVSLLITDRLKSPVRAIFSEKGIHLSCTTPIGKATDEVYAESNLKNDLEIAFNNKYMTDALKNAECDEIELHINGSLNPIKILPKGGESFLFMVLPVRVKAEQPKE